MFIKKTLSLENNNNNNLYDYVDTPYIKKYLCFAGKHC